MKCPYLPKPRCGARVRPSHGPAFSSAVCAFVRVRAGHGENPRLLLERHRLDLDRHQLGRDARKPASGRRRPRTSLCAEQHRKAADLQGRKHRQSQPDAICEGRAEKVQRRGPPRQGDVCARIPLLGDGRSDLSPQSRAAHLLPPGARQGDDDLADGSPGAPRLPERAAFGESEAVLVRRVGRLLRRRHLRRRHHRSAHQDLRRQLPHAAQRKAARRRALPAGRRRQDSSGRSDDRGPGRLHQAVAGAPPLAARARADARILLRRGRNDQSLQAGRGAVADGGAGRISKTPLRCARSIRAGTGGGKFGTREPTGRRDRETKASPDGR